MVKRTYTQEEKLRAVVVHLERGQSIPEVAKAYGLPAQLVLSWVKKYQEQGFVGLEDRRGKRKKDQTPRTELEKAQIEIEQLKHKLYLAEMERDLLKKLDEIERRDAVRKQDSAASMLRSGKHTRKMVIPLSQPASCSTQRVRHTTGGLPAS